MRRIPIRLKLVGALLVPLVALITVTAVEARSIADDVRAIKDEAELAETSLGPSSLVTHLEHERDAAGVYIIGQEDVFALPVEDNADARRQLDAALAEFRDDIEARGGWLREVYTPALEALGGLEELRREVDGHAEGPRTLDDTDDARGVFDGYSEIMDVLFAANRQVVDSIHDSDLRRGAELYDLTARQTDAVARLVRTLLLPAVAGEANGLDQPDEIGEAARGLAEVEAYDRQIQLVAQDEYAPLADELYAVDHIVQFPREARNALDTGQVDVAALMASSTGPDPEQAGYTAFRSEVSDLLQEQADDVRGGADARRLRYLALALVTVALALLITWLVSRSITRPLQSLTRQAREMADRRLPTAVREVLDAPLGDDVQIPQVERVQVATRDEVADVVDALNTVQDSALDLAVEQAVLRRNIADSFVNLGRRNQNLLGRQLDFITELESNETDPDTLASLFRLDHLATRMRRNAESLLVLAGIDPPRKWAAPVRLTDVIRAALGEVEDYQRVVLRQVEPATILGSAAADMAHLIAEFVENALTFSPPDRTVDVYGAPGADGSYTLTIADGGFGMSPADLEQANRRLAGHESFTVAPSKYLGHYVAANLAARHGVAIRLDSPPGAGVTVTIVLPPALLTADAATPSVAAAAPTPDPRLVAVGAPVGPGPGNGPARGAPPAGFAGPAEHGGYAGYAEGVPPGGFGAAPAGYADDAGHAAGVPPAGSAGAVPAAWVEPGAPQPAFWAGGPEPGSAPVAPAPPPERRRTAGGLPIRRPAGPRAGAAAGDGSAQAEAQDQLLSALTRQQGGPARRLPGVGLQRPENGWSDSGADRPGGEDGPLHDLLSRFSDGRHRASRREPPPPPPPERG